MLASALQHYGSMYRVQKECRQLEECAYYKDVQSLQLNIFAQDFMFELSEFSEAVV